MKISSTLKDQRPYGDSYIVLDVKTVTGSFHASLGVGAIEGRMPYLSPTGQEALQRLNELSGHLAQRLRLINVASSLKAKTVVPKAFTQAKQGDSVFFFCKNSHVYNTVFNMLGLDSTKLPHMAEALSPEPAHV